jgi:hypothetical protein
MGGGGGGGSAFLFSTIFCSLKAKWNKFNQRIEMCFRIRLFFPLWRSDG